MKPFFRFLNLVIALLFVLSIFTQVGPVGAKSLSLVSHTGNNNKAYSSPVNVTYVDLVVDMARNRLYGTDKVGNKVDVIDMDDMHLISSYNLVSGANPTYLDLRPDGAELAVAQSALNTIAFINLQDGAVTQSASLGVKGTDVLYGRDGILYVLSTAGIHVFDASTHLEDTAQKVVVGSYNKTGVLSPDKNVLYLVDNSLYSGYSISYKFDVSAGLPKPLKTGTVTLASNTASISLPEKYIKLSILENGNILTSSGWELDPALFLKSKTSYSSNPAISIPGRNFYAVATDETSGADKIHFFDQSNSYEAAWLSTETLGTLGAIAVTPDGSVLYLSSTAGMSKFGIDLTPPGTTVPLPVSTHQYRDFAFDLARNVVYGTSTGGTVDVISADDGSVLQEYLLPSGASPVGIDLSPDGSEIAVALNGLRSILFMNPESGEAIASVQPTIGDEGGIYYLNLPFDVIYGRSGRLYSDGNPGSGGIDYVHVIDSLTHTWVAKSPYPNTLRTGTEFVLTTDNQNLYAGQTFSPNNIYVFDVRTDTVNKLYSGPHGPVIANRFTIQPDGSKVFTSAGQVWTGTMSEQIGSFSSGNLIDFLPGKDVFALTVRSGAVDIVEFFRASDYQLISSYTLPVPATILEMESSPDGNKLALSLSTGQVLMLDLTVPQATLLDGANQFAYVGQVFPKPLKLKVQSLLGTPISGINVTFTAPADGASAIFDDTKSNITTSVTDENGVATSAALAANSLAGSYQVTATLSGVSSPLAFSLVNNIPYYTISGNAGLETEYLTYTYGGTLRAVNPKPYGNYFIRVPAGWTGVITPFGTGYTFSPASIVITEPLAADLPDQDFTPTRIIYTVSGTLGANGSGAIITYSGGSTIAGVDGSYSFPVPYGWTGAITPSKTGYTFLPASISITEPITADLANQNFTVSINTYVVSGTLGVSGAGATINYSGGSTTANSAGNYSFTVLHGWVGAITPSKLGYTFSPASIKITKPVTADLLNQNFTPALITYIVSGSLGSKGAGATVAYTGGSTIADSKGYYSFAAPYGWTGIITPAKVGYIFLPDAINVAVPLKAHLPNQNFTTKQSRQQSLQNNVTNPIIAHYGNNPPGNARKPSSLRQLFQALASKR